MIAELEQISKNALEALAGVVDEAALEAWRVAHLGRSSALMQVFDRLGSLPREERPQIGKAANEVKRLLESRLEALSADLHQQALQRALQTEHLDVTLPGRPLASGRLHPSTQILRRIYGIFAEMGFQVYRSREVESDEYNFELLNIPSHHPARDMWDTFHTLTPGVLLRTHTSPGQIRVMREQAPEPIRVILPGMCFRYEQISARKEIQFNQVEGLVVGEGITFGDLKGTLADFARRMFNPEVRMRFRAAYFPFTEPSAEVDIECFICGGKGCPVCSSSGWLEILGCGMVHPTVLRNGGYDSERFTGYAFGMGPERIAMLRYRISDIRYFWANDMRFLEQFE
jgi:phenylalanyl-tRNA synthetase alpha chain